MKRNRFFAILVVGVILSLLSVTLIATPALAAPTITLSPEEGSAGTTVTVTGTNFGSYAGDTIHVCFGGIEIAGSPLTIPANGEFTITFQVPENTARGTSYVTVRDGGGNQLGEGVPFFVPTPTINLSVSGGIVGTTVTLSGKGFNAGGLVTFYYVDRDTTELGSITTDPVGEISSYSFTVPESTAQEHKVSAIDVAGNEAEATFTVIPAVILIPISGAIGDSVDVKGTGFGYNSQIGVDFGDRQVATAKASGKGSFSASFSVPDMPLQNHNVEAIDTEGNTATIQFTITAGDVSFIFPQWGIYAAIGFGGLVLFFFGFWLGRKYTYTF